jgi:hypothetical protein
MSFSYCPEFDATVDGGCLPGQCGCFHHHEMVRLRAELTAVRARAEKAEAQLHRSREEERAVEDFLAQEGDKLASNAEYKPSCRRDKGSS